jgi:hypothetical protein
MCRRGVIPIGSDGEGLRLVDAAVKEDKIGNVAKVAIDKLLGEVECADEADPIEIVSEFAIEACHFGKAATRKGRDKEWCIDTNPLN